MKTLLKADDSFELEPFAYPQIWDLSRDAEKNTWSPEEISVADDVADWRDPNLDPRHRHLFETILAQLTTFDIQRGDDAAETFLNVFQPAEIKHYLKRLIWEEALHTRSYRYIIENFGIGTEIYSRYKTVQIMHSRVTFAQSISDPVRVIVAQQILEPKELTLFERKTILRSLIFWTVSFEGVWFWMNLLGPIQQLSRIGVFRRAAEQFAYIARDESLHIRFGVDIIKHYIAENPDCITEEFLCVIKNDVKHAVDLEAAFITYAFEKGPIMGYSPIDHLQACKFFADLRLRACGLSPIFDVRFNPFTWFGETLELKKERNFFETRVTEYQTGGALTWDDE